MMPAATPGAAQAPAPSRFNALDGLRGVAAVGVVLYHVIEQYAFWCWSFVDLFFVLSGFLITRIVLTSPLPPGLMLKRFWMRRVLLGLNGLQVVVASRNLERLARNTWKVPAHRVTFLRNGVDVPLLMLAYGVAKTLQSGGAFQMQDVAASFAFVQFVQYHWLPLPSGVASHYIPWFVHSWSIAIEEQFYLVWPLLLIACRKQLNWLLPLGLGLMVASFWLRLEGSADFLLATRLDGLMLGSLLAIAYLNPQYRVWRWLLVPLAAYGLLVVGTYFWQGYGVFFGVHKFDQQLSASIILVPGFAVLYTLLIGHCVTSPQSPVARLLSVRPLLYLGSISYPLYMLHLPAAGLMQGVGQAMGYAHPPVALLMLALPIAIAGAHVSTITLEKVFNRYKHRYPMDRV